MDSQYSHICERIALLEYDGIIQVKGEFLNINQICSTDNNNNNSNNNSQSSSVQSFGSIVTFTLITIVVVIAIIVSVIILYHNTIKREYYTRVNTVSSSVHQSSSSPESEMGNHNDHDNNNTGVLTVSSNNRGENGSSRTNYVSVSEETASTDHNREVVVIDPAVARNQFVSYLQKTKDSFEAMGFIVNKETILQTVTSLYMQERLLYMQERQMHYDHYQQSLNREMHSSHHSETMETNREVKDWLIILIRERENSLLLLCSKLYQTLLTCGIVLIVVIFWTQLNYASNQVLEWLVSFTLKSSYTLYPPFIKCSFVFKDAVSVMPHVMFGIFMMFIMRFIGKIGLPKICELMIQGMILVLLAIWYNLDKLVKPLIMLVILLLAIHTSLYIRIFQHFCMFKTNMFDDTNKKNPDSKTVNKCVEWFDNQNTIIQTIFATFIIVWVFGVAAVHIYLSN